MKTTRPAGLIFAYNSNSGLLNDIWGIFRAALVPQSGPCRLSALTHTALGFKTQWAEHLKKLNMPINFVHRNQLKNRFGISNIELPAVFAPNGDRLRLLIDADEINRCRDVENLIILLDRYVATS